MTIEKRSSPNDTPSPQHASLSLRPHERWWRRRLRRMTTGKFDAVPQRRRDTARAGGCLGSLVVDATSATVVSKIQVCVRSAVK